MNEQSKLNGLLAAFKSIQIAKRHLIKLKPRLKEESEKLEELTLILNKEYDDLVQLEKMGITKLFSKFLGSYEEKYEIERQEYLHAFLQYKSCKKSIELLEFEINIIREKIEEEEEVRLEIEQLIITRDELTAKNYPSIKNKLQRISEKRDRHLDYIRELREAIGLSYEIQSLFSNMIQLFRKTNQEGQWKLNSAFKTFKENDIPIDQAHQLFFKVKQLLLKLDDELEDIYAFKRIGRWHKFKELQHFNVIYYDRLISDWVVKGSVDSTLNYIQGLNDSVDMISKSLEYQVSMTERKTAKLEEEQAALIANLIK